MVVIHPNYIFDGKKSVIVFRPEYDHVETVSICILGGDYHYQLLLPSSVQVEPNEVWSHFRPIPYKVGPSFVVKQAHHLSELIDAVASDSDESFSEGMNSNIILNFNIFSHFIRFFPYFFHSF